MIRRLITATALTVLIATPVLADTQIAPSTGVNSDAANSSTLQPNAANELQSAQGISGGGVSALTGGVALQPAGDQANVSALLLGGVEGSPQESSDTAVDHSTAVAMAIAAFGFVVAALLIFRTSKRLDRVNEPLVEIDEILILGTEENTAPKPAKRKPKKVPKKPKTKPKSRKS